MGWGAWPLFSWGVASCIAQAQARGYGHGMIGYIATAQRGASDLLIADLATRLQSSGMIVAGAVQINSETDRSARCNMDLRVLQAGHIVRISQSLGPQSRGCRLDPAGLEEAAGLVEADLGASAPPHILIVNKFGKHECDGRGFAPAIAKALERDIPVILAVSPLNEAAFLAWAGEFAQPVAAIPAQMDAWCRAQIGA